VYPALAVLQALIENVDLARLDENGPATQAFAAGTGLSTLWVGGVGGMEADLVKRASVPYTAIPAAGVHGVDWRAMPGNLWQLGRGFLASRRLLRQFRPDVLFFTGGYVAVPMALAARSIRLTADGGRTYRPRSLLYVPDIEPGLALKTLARFADRIAITAENSRPYFPGREDLSLTGYPTRRDLRAWDPEKARHTLGLSADLPILLVSGGSRGARSINRALLAALPELLGEIQVLHISGQLDWPEVEAAREKLSSELPPEMLERYRAYPYLHEEMGAALSIAGLALSRAGASILGEYPLFGVPAILVPYPYAWRYQQVNAEYLAKNEAAVIIDDADLQEQLLPVVRRLLKDARGLEKMRAAMRALSHPQAASTIAGLIQTLALDRHTGR
jgi:UDP-N-acetylglucosamine:LPS N-acetylglucosamine transferase